MPDNFKQLIENALYTGGIGSFGGISFYLYKISQGNDFSWIQFFVNMFLAFFVGYVVGTFLPATDYTNGLLAISGFSSYGILQFLEQKGASIILKNIKKGK